MLQKSYQQTSDLLFTFGLFFLSNLSALIVILWLIPQFVFLESIIWLIAATFSLWILNRRNLTDKFLENLRRNWIILPFLVFSGLSIFWSVDWEISLYRWLILVFTIIAAAYIGLRYDIKKFVEVLSVFGIAILFVGLFFVIFLPEIGVMNYYSIQGAWKGLYWHKNHMGLIATFINILFLINILDSQQSKEKRILLWAPLYLFSLLFLYQSDSAAALIVTIFLHGIIFLALMLIKFRKKIHSYHYVILIIALIFASVILYMNIDYFFQLFNRNSTLTGRIPMWSHLFGTYFSQRPFGGYGFNAFWYVHSHRVAMQHAAGYPDPIVIADNGFIDILINTGYIGLFLFSIFYFGVWWRSIRYASQATGIYGIFPVILMSYTLLANISWSLIFENESFFMLIMITILFCISSRAVPGEANEAKLP
jgi:O-antigen ligase